MTPPPPKPWRYASLFPWDAGNSVPALLDQEVPQHVARKLTQSGGLGIWYRGKGAHKYVPAIAGAATISLIGLILNLAPIVRGAIAGALIVLACTLFSHYILDRRRAHLLPRWRAHIISAGPRSVIEDDFARKLRAPHVPMAEESEQTRSMEILARALAIRETLSVHPQEFTDDHEPDLGRFMGAAFEYRRSGRKADLETLDEVAFRVAD